MKTVFLLLLAAAVFTQVNPSLVNLPGNTWLKMSPSFDPPGLDFNGFGHPKTESKLVFDEKNNVAVWFGGCSNGYTNSVWHYSVAQNKWTRINDLVYEQGGVEAEGPFSWDPKTCTSLPGGQCHYSITYDANTERVIKHTGISSSFPPDQNTWAYNAAVGGWQTSWAKLVDLGAGNASIQGLTHDRENGKTVLFGQLCGYGGNLGTWSLDFSAAQWTSRSPSSPPPDRGWACFEFHQKLKKCVLFGGAPYSGPVRNDTWLYDYAANAWQQVFPANPPPPRTRASMAYDARNEVMIMFGGNDTHYGAGSSAGTLLNDTWILDIENNTWIEMQPAAGPANAKTWQGAYDPVNNVMVVVDMASATWVYRYKKASTGVQKAKVTATSLGVFPNPFRGSIRITAGTGARVSVFSPSGKLAARSVAGKAGWTWRPRGLAPGWYMVRAEDGKHTAFKKILMMK